jgi:hypothetical protein
MRLKNHVRILATAATLAAVTAPAAEAAAVGEGGGGELPVAAAANHSAISRHQSSSTDWELIGLAGGGTVVLVAAGLGGSVRLTRRRASAVARASHVA